MILNCQITRCLNTIHMYHVNLKMLINCFIISSFSLAAVLFSTLYCAADEAASQVFGPIKEYALFADAAYQTQADITNTLKKQAYQLTRYSNIPDYEVSYFLAKNDRAKRQILSVRGTSNLENVIAVPMVLLMIGIFGFMID